MSIANIWKFRDALLARRTELEKQLADSAESAEAVDLDQPIGRLSRMDAMQQQQMTLAGRRIAEQRLRQIAAALERIEADAYGICVACEEEIDPDRLRARPESPFCVDCQERRERR
ncbi:TraR/DksA family transcriptional regulator [Geothermobacter hydrogeniphilus]|uniref:Zinc finger DksA/TraR C4-type domain-containing protein n=1 Tax=Geothermobacter hydrogeniphilus TaxID=1969733 RepID=A0A1X0YE13_9BACT|nr:TraR/DksA family transcriptional regulator [Geothermobacter hydrogeniphilus]ORJ63420.1 hypothetical protein B5V00_00720 [Geothermobacter hydrogeniphilus]